MSIIILLYFSIPGTNLIALSDIMGGIYPIGSSDDSFNMDWINSSWSISSSIRNVLDIFRSNVVEIFSRPTICLIYSSYFDSSFWYSLASGDLFGILWWFDNICNCSLGYICCIVLQVIFNLQRWLSSQFDKHHIKVYGYSSPNCQWNTLGFEKNGYPQPYTEVRSLKTHIFLPWLCTLEENWGKRERESPTRAGGVSHALYSLMLRREMPGSDSKQRQCTHSVFANA